MKFNLQKIKDDLIIKEAMGAAYYRYRDQIHWSRIEDAVRGTAVALTNEDPSGGSATIDITWAEIKRSQQSATSVLREILNFKAEKEAFFMSRYGLPKQKVKDIFQVFVGYHPFYGCYMCSVGPYFSSPQSFAVVKKFAGDRDVVDVLDEAIASTDKKLSEAAKRVKADKANRFGFFTRRYQRATQEEIVKSAQDYLEKRMSSLAQVMNTSDLQLSLEDLQLIVKRATGERKNVNLKYDKDVFNNLDPQSTQGGILYARRPIMGSNSTIKFNASGIAKIMEAASKSGNWVQVYEQALTGIAQENGTTVERIKETMLTDISIAKSIFDAAKNIQAEMIARGDPAASLMSPIPSFDIMSTEGRTGQQLPTTIATRESQIALVQLRSEILDIISKTGTDDPDRIMASLTELRSQKKLPELKAKGAITAETISLFIDHIKNSRKVKGPDGKFVAKKTYPQMAEEAKAELNAVREAVGGKVDEGFTDLETTFYQASLYFYSPGSDVVDPKSKAKISALYIMPPDLFHRGQENKNIKSKDLYEMRTKARKFLGEEEEIIKNIPIASPLEMEQEIGISQQTEQKPEEVDEKDLPVDNPDNMPDATDEVAVEGVENEVVAPPVSLPDSLDVPAESFPITEVDQEVIPSEQPTQPAQPDVSDIEGVQPVDTQESPDQPPVNQMDSVVPRKKRRLTDLVGETLESLIKIARDLDAKKKFSAAEEVHEIIRKYQKGI